MIEVQKANEIELRLLGEHRRKAETLLIRDRAHAILLVHKGYGAPEIADILDRDRGTGEKWIKTWNRIRMASIFPKYEGNGNASKLTSDQRQEIQRTLLCPPSDYGLPESFWTVKSLKRYLRAEYGAVYESDRSYHHLFSIMGYSFKLPGKQDRRRDDAFIEIRMNEIQTEVMNKRKEGYTVFAADECSLYWETILRRAWITRGEKTIVKAESNKERQNYFGALNLNSSLHELISLEWQDTPNLVQALRELTERYPQQKLCIIWDNAQWHRSSELKKLLGSVNEFEHIHLIWLPPYAPDKNPEEHVWKVGKDAVANTVSQTFNGLKHIFETTVSHKLFDYHL